MVTCPPCSIGCSASAAYVVGAWYEQLLHNQSALRLKGRLLFTPGVMVASVPWQLRSAEGTEARLDGPTAGSVRRGQ